MPPLLQRMNFEELITHCKVSLKWMGVGVLCLQTDILQDVYQCGGRSCSVLAERDTALQDGYDFERYQ